MIGIAVSWSPVTLGYPSFRYEMGDRGDRIHEPAVLTVLPFIQVT